MIRLTQITDSIAAKIAIDAIKRTKQDWYIFVKNNAEESKYNELRSFFKSNVCRLYCAIIDLYTQIGNGEDNQGAYYSMQQLLKQLEEDRINGIVREVPDEVL